tara:strand:- start:221 stop:1060 length:840 start_codon:yes stop_codon:yes gene_type:complete
MPGHHGSSGKSMGVSQGNQETGRERAIRAAATPGKTVHTIGAPEGAHEYINGNKVYIGDEIGKQQALESGNVHEEAHWTDDIKNAITSYVKSGGSIGLGIKLTGAVLEKLGEYSEGLQKKAMTYSLNNKLKSIQNQKDFHPGAYGYKISDIQGDLDGIAAGTFSSKDFTEKYGSSDPGSGDGTVGERLRERDAMNLMSPVAPYLVSDTTPQESVAAKWYANLGKNNASGHAFSFAKAYSTAKAKQTALLGKPSSVGLLAVNNSPFYNFLKERNLDKGIL